MAGEIVSTKLCFPKSTLKIFPYELQVMKLQPPHVPLHFQKLAIFIGYPNAASTSSKVVTCESQGP
jgi:hypothetical protein